MMEKCHLCGNTAAEFSCRDCEESVCEDCCVPFTLQNQVDFTICTCCYEGKEARRTLAYWEEEERQERIDEERKLKNEKSRERYRKPENIKKRRIAREERKKAEAEYRAKMLSGAIKVVNNWF